MGIIVKEKIIYVSMVEDDDEIRTEQYVDFQRFLVEESPVIFIEHPKIYKIERKSIIKPILTKLLQFGRKSTKTES